ncbi:MAG: nucleotide sugar dehydrogenase, partial [Spirochaetota bacterium]
MSTESRERTALDVAQELQAKIESRTAVVGVVGLGYVGLPACIGIVAAGLSCVGFDIDAEKIASLRDGRSYLKHIAITDLTEAMGEERFTPTDDFDAISECDAVLITVPTPLDVHHQPDLSFVEATCRSIAPRLRRGMLVVLESTTYPGTTNEVVIPILEESGLRSGTDFFVGFSPEREDPGNKSFTTTDIPKVVAGAGELAGGLVESLYRCTHRQVVVVPTPEVAEASKLLENIFRSVNIAMVNELKMVFAKMGIDVWDVIAAASTKPFGFMPFYPGPG